MLVLSPTFRFFGERDLPWDLVKIVVIRGRNVGRLEGWKVVKGCGGSGRAWRTSFLILA